MKPLILASNSLYKKQLFTKLNLEFITDDPDIDEQAILYESAEQLSLRLATEKAHALKNKYPGHLIIGSDQVASSSGQLLGKPGNKAQAIKQLTLQSGSISNFYTSICVLDTANNQFHTDLDVCKVHFKHLSKNEIDHYVQRDRPYDCAGSFKSEELGIALFQKIEGDDPNALIGLPLIKLIGVLSKFDINVL